MVFNYEIIKRINFFFQFLKKAVKTIINQQRKLCLKQRFDLIKLSLKSSHGHMPSNMVHNTNRKTQRVIFFIRFT